MKMKKIVVLGLALSILTGGISGCNQSKEGEDGRVAISIGDWPDETNTEGYELADKNRKEFEEKNPDIKIVPDTYVYDTKTFTMKAVAHQLPTMFGTWYTEINQLIKSGYVADVTEYMEKYGYTKIFNPDLIKTVSDENGRIYGFPTGAYSMGLTINKTLFREAGLINEDGTVMIPDTYEQMAEYAKIIKEKTGKSGFCICTTNNCGGWHFMNIAWSYGVNFMEKDENGKWKATFDTPEAAEALQYIKDLKWKYDVLPDDQVIDQPTAHKMLGTGQTAMFFEAPGSADYSVKYGMDLKELSVAKMPAGPKGRYTQMGGGLKMFSADATPEQLDACFRYLQEKGYSTEFTDEEYKQTEESYKLALAQGGIILDKDPFPVWVDGERVEKLRELRLKYININPEDFESYYDFSDTILKPEEPACAQQLYAVLDKCIQEVISNENADPAKIMADACQEFQVNHLDKIDY